MISQYSTPMIVRTKEGGMYTRSNAFVITTAIADEFWFERKYGFASCMNHVLIGI